mgnify:CR=1 FL=1
MEIEVPKDTTEKISKASKILGIKREELVDRAVLLYLDTMSRYLDLKQEMKEWDKLSGEAIINFEKSL